MRLIEDSGSVVHTRTTRLLSAITVSPVLSLRFRHRQLFGTRAGSCEGLPISTSALTPLQKSTDHQRSAELLTRNIRGMIEGDIFLALVVLFVVNMGSTAEPSEVATTATDISHWQPDPDWHKVIHSGIQIVIHKATQGLAYVDKDYERRRAAARAAGLKYWGAYHFADGTDGVQQADHFLNIAGDADFLAIDLETNPAGSTVTTEVAEQLALTIREKTDRFPLVYGSPNFLNNRLNDSAVLAKCPLWVANWKEFPPIVPKMWDDWVLWQYTDGAKGPSPHEVPGIGKCDRDKVNTTAFLSYLER